MIDLNKQLQKVDPENPVRVIGFGEKAPLDPTIKTISMTNMVVMPLIAFIMAGYSILFTLFTPISPIPYPNPPLTKIEHVKGTVAIGFAKILPTFKGETYYSYNRYLNTLIEKKQYHLVSLRWLVAIIVALVSSYLVFLKTLVPAGGIKHIKGKFVLKGMDAYKDLAKEFYFLSADGRGSGLVVSSMRPFDPTKQTIDDLALGTYIELPEKLRRAHSMYAGGTGRGKTQAIYYREVAQNYPKIRAGQQIKMMICDTPKGDYLSYFHERHCYRISPHLEGGVAWNIAEDLTDGLLANAFWTGKIPASDSDPIWSNAAIAIGTGCTRYLQVVAPKSWNYGMLAYMLTKSGDELEPLLSVHYPEAKQILNSAGETLSSVLFNLGTYTTDIISLARIHDGFDSKQCIRQATAKALKNPAYVEFVSKELIDPNLTGNPVGDNQTKSIMFKGTCLYLNSRKEAWTWQDFSDFVQRPKAEQARLILPFITKPKEAEVIDGCLLHLEWLELAQQIIVYAEEWDHLESQRKFSVKKWIMDENPRKKILLLVPSETYPTLTEGLIKGILYYSNSVILGKLKNSKTRKFYILIDEFQSYGNIEKFISPALSLYRSRGVSITLAFQDLAQITKIYGQEFVDFMNSNIGNINILGVNDGFTSQKLSDLLGDRKIEKLHRTKNADGLYSEDLQHHDEKVMYANEFNLLGANDATRSMKYLYLAGGLNPAYILEAPLLNYIERTTPQPAKWIDAEPSKPKELPDLQRRWRTTPSVKPHIDDNDYPTADELEEELSNQDE